MSERQQRRSGARARTRQEGKGCRTGAAAGSPGGGRYRRAVLEPAILMTLLGGESHGYDLIEEIDRLVAGEVCVDPGSVYRMLREMEERGWVSSRWEIAERGPNRRSYSLTTSGLAALEAAVAELRRRARALDDLAREATTRQAAGREGLREEESNDATL